jgi:sec-independent protein translocase protein TatA
MNIENAILQHAGWLGGPEIAVIVLVVILLFGGRKIPELMRGLGKGIKEFKEGVADNDDKSDDKDKNKEEKE